MADALRVHLSADARHTAIGMDDLKSDDYYLIAKREFVRYEPGGLERALGFIESARARVGDIRDTPDFASLMTSVRAQWESFFSDPTQAAPA